MMNSAGGQYRGVLDCMVKAIRQAPFPARRCSSLHDAHRRRADRNDGFLSLYRGFVPAYARLGPHTIIMFVALEQLKRIESHHWVARAHSLTG